MTKTEAFLDTNIVIHALIGAPPLAEPAFALLKAGGTVSVQVLNECANTLRRKFSADWPEIKLASERIRELCAVVPVTEEIHARGLDLAERYVLSTYDAMIVAAAQLAGCTVLYSEDMHDGLIIDQLTVRNPYRAPPVSPEQDKS
jgi:predicted nucleic acid-binding protein